MSKMLSNSYYLLLIFAISHSEGAAKISLSLLKSLEITGKVDIFLSFAQGTTPVINGVSQRKFETRADRVTWLTEALKENARHSQEKIWEFLSLQKDKEHSLSSFISFWITNQIFIKDAKLALVEQLASTKEVVKIRVEEAYLLDAPMESRETAKPVDGEIQWGILKIGAPAAWSDPNGNNGTGIVVGTIDTGVRGTHEALAHNFLGPYGWYDPYFFEDVPSDNSGHGTHTLATIVGRNGVGVAPNAKWMHCRGCKNGFCIPDAVLSCSQFILCPTDTKGENPDCSKAPHIASNSFGGGQGRDLLWPVFKAWRAADITIIFSNGNSGPWCGTANSHADSPLVIGVGGTTSMDSLYTFSSVGPSVYGDIKPDIAAPAVDVVSAYYTSDDAYYVMTGTSMAAPHVSGAITILKSANPNLTFEEIKQHLSAGAEKNLALTGRRCGGIPEDSYPNHAYGVGRVNIVKSLHNLHFQAKSERVL